MVFLSSIEWFLKKENILNYSLSVWLKCVGVIHMNTLEEVQVFFSHPEVIRMYQSFLQVRDRDFPDQNYIGINFKNDKIVSIKFYFAVYRRLSPREIAMFLPDAMDFLTYYHLWDSTNSRSNEHTGCTFEVKFKGSSDPVLGFHYRLRPTNEAYKLVGSAQTLPFDASLLGTRPGINYEYEKSRVLRKRYYYFESKEQKSYLAKRFNKPFIEQCAFAEFAEFDGEAKVNVWRLDYSEENMMRPSGFSVIAQRVITDIRKKYGLINISDGYYEQDGTAATYFFGTKGGSKYDPFPDPVNFHIDTMSFLLRNSSDVY